RGFFIFKYFRLKLYKPPGANEVPLLPQAAKRRLFSFKWFCFSSHLGRVKSLCSHKSPRGGFFI
ncbi:MAG: hypothetical protein IJ483_04135, partial [Flavobacteriales bacterium]|nr:hypothetical protein [Flavobacteriales bacterium]